MISMLVTDKHYICEWENSKAKKVENLQKDKNIFAISGLNQSSLGIGRYSNSMSNPYKSLDGHSSQTRHPALEEYE